jgi:hypothetical protein
LSNRARGASLRWQVPTIIIFIIILKIHLKNIIICMININVFYYN